MPARSTPPLLLLMQSPSLLPFLHFSQLQAPAKISQLAFANSVSGVFVQVELRNLAVQYISKLRQDTFNCADWKRQGEQQLLDLRSTARNSFSLKAAAGREQGGGRGQSFAQVAGAGCVRRWRRFAADCRAATLLLLLGLHQLTNRAKGLVC